MYRNATRLAALVTSLLVLAAGAHAASSTWAATALCDGMSVAHAINESGAVAGAMGSAPSEQAVVCDSDGTLTVLPVPDGTTSSRAQGINDRGDVVGSIQIEGAQEAAVWDADGSITRLGFLPEGGRFSSAHDVNNSGVVVGIANLGSEYRGFRWAGTGPIEALPLPAGQTGSMAVAINDAGQIVGNASALLQPGGSAVLWDDGLATALEPLAEGAMAAAEDINDLGQIVGNSGTSEQPYSRHPVRWDGGVATELGAFGGPFASATAINDSGLVVGLMLDASFQAQAFVWDGGALTPLEPLAGDTGSASQDVDDAGRVVGASFSGSGSRATSWSRQADTTPPSLSVSVSPSVLWPPNHGYVAVHASVTAIDEVDPNPTVTLVPVTSNEPDDGPGDGNTTSDVAVDGQYSFRLRAEPNEYGTGRVYTITYPATDTAGNTSTASATVSVPLTR